MLRKPLRESAWIQHSRRYNRPESLWWEVREEGLPCPSEHPGRRRARPASRALPRSWERARRRRGVRRPRRDHRRNGADIVVIATRTQFHRRLPMRAVRRATFDSRIGGLRHMGASDKGHCGGYGLVTVGTQSLSSMMRLAAHCRGCTPRLPGMGGPSVPATCCTPHWESGRWRATRSRRSWSLTSA